jgi:hypothetical protein
MLLSHTKRQRIIKSQSTLSTKAVIESLLRKWVNVKDDILLNATPVIQDEETRRFEKDLHEYIELEEKLDPEFEFGGRAVIRGRSYSPPPVRHRLPPPHRITRHRDYVRNGENSKTEYWRPWGDNRSALLSSLRFRGWQPVYMRGTDAGQTWFYGKDVVHVRRFEDGYMPQEGPVKTTNDTTGANATKANVTEYLIISTEWVEEEAIQRIGFQYQLLPSGHFSLDPRITWGDIELLLGATATFREERLYRKYRGLPGGDLFEEKSVPVPQMDFLHGPRLAELDLTERARDAQRRSSGVSKWRKEADSLTVNGKGKDADVGESVEDKRREEEANGDDTFVEVERRRV